MPTDIWEIAAGSVTGRDHSRFSKNNQDAYYHVAKGEILVATVSDGCSAGVHSEVGAQIGCRLIANNFCRSLAEIAAVDLNRFTMELMLERARLDTLAHIRVLTKEMGTSFSSVIEENFLFTVLGAAITPRYTMLFAVGDGLFFLNGEKIELGPFPQNKPPYLSYALVNTTLGNDENLFRLQTVRFVETEAVKTLIIGTDGVVDLVRVENSLVPGRPEMVGPISQFSDDDRYFNNPDLIRRHLHLINRELRLWDQKSGTVKTENGLLPDDTTLVSIRRK